MTGNADDAATRAERAITDLDPAHGHVWGQPAWAEADRIVHSRFLRRYLAQIAGVGSRPALPALTFRHIRFPDGLDLSDLGTPATPLPDLIFQACTFDGPLRVDRTHMTGLAVADCRLAHGQASDISARNCRCTAGLSLARSSSGERTRFDFADAALGGDVRVTAVSHGRVILANARLDGRLVIDACESEATGISLEAPGITVGHGLQIAECSRVGPLVLTSATISGGLSLSRAPLSFTRTGDALQAPRSRIFGDVAIGNAEAAALEIAGTIDLADTQITGNLALTNIHSRPIDDDAPSLRADRASIGGDVDLGGGTPRSYFGGAFRLGDATVKGNVTLHGLHIETKETAKPSEAVWLRRCAISGHLRLIPDRSERVVLDGPLDLEQATCGGEVKLDSVRIAVPKEAERALPAGKWAVNGENAHFHNGVAITTDDAQAPAPSFSMGSLGGITLASATLNDSLRLMGVTCTAHEAGQRHALALCGDNAEIDGDVEIDGRATHQGVTPAQFAGTLALSGAHVTGRLRAGNIVIMPPDGNALKLDGATIEDGVFLDNEEYPRNEKPEPREKIFYGHIQVTACRISRYFGIKNALVCANSHTDSSQDDYKGRECAFLMNKTEVDKLCLFFQRDSSVHIDLTDSWARAVQDNGGAWSMDAEAPCNPRLTLLGFRYERLEAPPSAESGDDGTAGDDSRGKYLTDESATTRHGPLAWLRWREFDVRRRDDPIAARRVDWLYKQFTSSDPSRPGRNDTRARLPNHREFRPQPFEQLAAVLMRMGYSESAWWISREKRYLQMRLKKAWLGKLGLQIFGLCFGFGYSAVRATATLVVLYLAAILATGLALPGIDDSCGVLTANFWITGFDIVIPALDFPAAHICRGGAAAPHWYRVGKALLLVLGWLAIPLAALTYSGLLRRA